MSIPVITAAQAQDRRKQVEQWLLDGAFDRITEADDVALAAAIDREAVSTLARLRDRRELSELHQAALAWRQANPTAGKNTGKTRSQR